MRKLHTAVRIGALGALFVLICAVYLVVLVNVQITGQDYYDIIKEETTTRYVEIAAKRGEIYDTNGKALVINTQIYDISLEYGAMPKQADAFNAVILDVLAAIEESGGAYTPVEVTFPFTGSFPNYEKDAEFFKSATNKAKYAALLRRLELDEYTAPEELFNFLRTRYGLSTYTKKTKTYTDLYDAETLETLMRIRFDMEYRQFSRVEPYTLARDVDTKLLTYVKERSILQVLVTEESARTYVYDGYASHLLGTIGKIPAEKLDDYIEKGYSGDAYVGISGAEAAYEDVLHGTDGTRAIVEDKYGNLISETVVKEPVAGSDVRLTIDINLQITAEDALADNIRLIREEADPKPGEHDGEDAHSGAVVATDPDTGAVLAAASYPTYRLSDYTENYAALAADETRPLYNRALLGTYTPGSTYKPGVAAAALSEGVITRNTTIVDKGAYDFGDYHPRCWIYLRFGRTHGAQTVVEAIQNSCNYFFYEVGNRLGIEKIDDSSRIYGLGEATGIELPESTGILAGPAYSESTGNVWNPGNTLQAAIGQSDNMFTPLQLSVYISTLLNGGTRYRAHMLRSVHAYPSGEVISETAPEVMSEVELDAGIVATVKSAMKDVVESGSAARIFRGYDITVGGKTGTAQVGGDRSDNALFVGFAPYDSPQLVVTVAIEQGANGTDAAYTAKALYDTYLKGQKYEKRYTDTETEAAQ